MKIHEKPSNTLTQKISTFHPKLITKAMLL